MVTLHRSRLQVEADRRGTESVRRLGAEIQRLREDSGLSKAIVARIAGIDATHLGYIEEGRREASAQVLARIAAALGAEASTRLFPSTGPPIRDRFQARMIEAFLDQLDPRWHRALEVAVQRPVRGVIDAVLSDVLTARTVALEAQSEIRRVEQQLRWSLAKAEALPSSAIWPMLVDAMSTPPMISSILLLRSTTTTRELARTFRSTFATAYPADPADLQRALRDPTAAWPGSGIVWVRLDGVEATILPG
jgi:transcriptional regulator with XRE-family HTH domain